MKEVKKDHEYLYILLNSRKDRERANNHRRLKQQSKLTGTSGTDNSPTHIFVTQDMSSTGENTSDADSKNVSPYEQELAELHGMFRKAQFGENPGKKAFNYMGKEWLGNIQWVSCSVMTALHSNYSYLFSFQSAVAGIRDFIYVFFEPVTTGRMALDISFGTIGYSLILSRAFNEVAKSMCSLLQRIIIMIFLHRLFPLISTHSILMKRRFVERMYFIPTTLL